MISIIFVGRNDKYGGNFEKRLFATVGHNVNQLDKTGVDYEIIFVEWNPLLLRRLLSKKIARKFPKAKCYVVHHLVHRYICANRHIKVYEYYAKNIAAKYARGQWLLLMNPDDFLGRDIIEFLAKGQFDEQTLYRSGWINIVDYNDVDNPALEDQTKDDTPPYTIYSGDFVFCTRKLFESAGGYREDLPFTCTHKDSIFCFTTYEITRKARKIGNVYHVKHRHNRSRKRRIKYDLFKVPLIRQKTFGLSEITEKKQIADRIYKLQLIKPLCIRAIFKFLPEPKVPEAYKIEPK